MTRRSLAPMRRFIAPRLLGLPAVQVLYDLEAMQRTLRESATLYADEAFGGVEYLHARYVDHAFDMHAHDEYVIAVVEGGAEAFRCGGARHVAPAGAVYTINPGEAHDGRGATASGWRYLALYPRPDVMARALGAAPPEFKRVVWNDVRAAALLRALHAVLRRQSCMLVKESVLARTMAYLTAANDGGRPQPSGEAAGNRHLDRIRDLLASSCCERHSLQSLSREAELHPIYLLNAFKRRFGVTPAAFLRAQRVARAKRLICNGVALGTVALETGFCDQAHFTRCFKRALGVTPGAYAAATMR